MEVKCQPFEMASYTKDVETAVHDGTDSFGAQTDELNAATLHDGTEEGKKAFLASFTAAEDKAIMRKVDWRFLWLIGITYLIKNSKSHGRGAGMIQMMPHPRLTDLQS